MTHSGHRCLLMALAAAALAATAIESPLAAQDYKQICPPCAAITSLQGGKEKIPADALKDKRWALKDKGINQPHAPDSPEARRYGAGSTILQIDTGVTAHPLLAAFDSTRVNDGGLDLAEADSSNIYGIGHKNTDPLLAGSLRFPGHGTKTSSVIIALPGGAFDDPTGAARGARVIPIRATQGVVLFPSEIGELNAQFSRVVTAINAAASGRFGRVDVISMSLGGWPPRNGICDAVDNAAKAGILVIAAAGNEVRRAKFPAMCKQAIAIAGSTYNQEPWEGSAGAPEVVAAAPAEGVWTASVVNGAYCLDASSGTSFATALVAAVAAEWVNQRRAKNAIPADPTAAFKEALRKTARPWKNAGWRNKFGEGIVDMSALLK
jgi:Subtilase family